MRSRRPTAGHLWICLPASDGNVYGLTAGGGDFGNGTIFVIDPGGSVTTIHSIPLSAGTAMTSLVKGSDGRFYVTAEEAATAEVERSSRLMETGH